MNSAKIEKYVDRLKNGDTAAFGQIYDATYKAVFFTAYKVLGDRHLAEDITQETYITVTEKLGLYRKGSNFCGWIITIAKRLAINEYNKRRGKEFSVDFLENESLYGEYSVDDNTERTALDIAADILTEEEYQIVMLCTMAGYKRREVAEMLEIPLSTVTWKYLEALKKIEKKYKEASQ